MKSELEKLFGLEGKVAVVIGGAGHLCSVLADAFSKVGGRVVVLDSSEKPPAGSDHRYLPCDVRSKSRLVECRDEILRDYGRIDVLLNGAGVNAPTPFFDIKQEEIDRILGVNLTGVLFACQVFGETMVKQKSGSIVNFASASSGPPLSKAFVYSISKAAVVSLTQNLAREWAPYNVRVNAIRPGFFPTEWNMKNFIDEARKAKILGHTPMARFGKPEELVSAILWLASEGASFTTGAVINVDGGFTAMTI